DAHADDADIKPIYDEEPMVEVQLIADHNVFATGQQHIEQPEFNNEEEVDQNAEQCHDTCPMPAKLTDNQTTELSNQSLESENIFTTHYLPKERESTVAKPHHMIAHGSSRYSSNDMVHNHYLKEAKKKTQESSRNSEPSVMPSARSQSTANDSKPKPRINNQKSRNWPASKSSCVTTKNVPDSLLNVKEVPQADETITMSNELDLLFSMMFDELLNGSPTVVSKTSVVTTANAFDKHQQQPDSTSSTSTLATTVTADGNFDVYIFLFFSLF
ncbi:hypothetical protein Tco_1477576, partial [Tanacetum coccineum]